MEKPIKKLLDNNIFVAVLGVIGLGLIYLLLEVVFVVIISFIVVIALRPIVTQLRKFNVPSYVSVPIIVALLLAAFGFLGYIIASGVYDQLSTLETSLTDAWKSVPFNERIMGDISFQSITQRLYNANLPLRSATEQLAHVVIAVITIFVLSIYWLLDYNHVKRSIVNAFNNKRRAKQVFQLLESNLGSWVRGQIVISIIVGAISFIVYSLIGLPAALALGVIAGLFEVIPTLGSILAAMLAVLIGLTVSPQIALITLLAAIAIQQAENQHIAPKVLQRTVNLHPIAIIIILYVGNLLYGLVGVFLSVPIALIIISIKKGITRA